MNPVRLAELNHQRALVREQLAWLEGEIAKETTAGGASVVVQSPPAPQSMVSTEAAQTATTPKIADEIIAYQPDPISAARDTRRGCFIAIAVSALVLISVFTAIYLLRYSDRPLLFVSDDAKAGENASPISPERPPKK